MRAFFICLSYGLRVCRERKCETIMVCIHLPLKRIPILIHYATRMPSSKPFFSNIGQVIPANSGNLIRYKVDTKFLVKLYPFPSRAVLYTEGSLEMSSLFSASDTLIITLPETLSTWPWKRCINPHYEHCKMESSRWLESLHAFSPQEQKKFNKCDFSMPLFLLITE